MDLIFWEIIVLISLSQGVVFSIVFLIPRTLIYSENNKFLALSIFLLSIIGFDELLETNQINDKYYVLELLGSDIPWFFLFYVPMFIYFLKSAKHPLSNSKKLWWLTVPFFIYLLFNLIIDLQVDFHLIDWAFIKHWQGAIYESEYFLSMLYITILCGLSYFVISKSGLTKAEKKWLQSIWGFNASILAIWIIAEFMPDAIYDNWNGEITYPVWISISVFIFWLTFRGLYQLELAKDKSAIHKIINGQKQTDEKHKEPEVLLNNCKPSPLVEYYQLFVQLMEKEQWYLNPGLSREDIAQQLGISPSYLSQVIKATGDKNLSTIINQYRVNEVKKMLADSSFRAFSIVAIGLEAGFKSKSSFYESFKKETGITPKQYKVRQNMS